MRTSRPDELAHATWSLDCAVAGLLAVLTVIPTAMLGLPGEQTRSEWLAAVVVGLALCCVTVLRRRRPLLTFSLALACCLAHLALLPLPTPSLLAVLLVVYSVPRWVPGPRARVVLLAGALGSVLGPLRWSRQITHYAPDPDLPVMLVLITMVGCGGLVLTCYVIGRRVRESVEAEHSRTLAEAERRALALAEHQQRALSTEATVRAQIARELHDIVAHSLSVMIVQAEGGRALAAKKPERAPEVLDTIAQTGREALTEMRRIVGVLRGSPDEVAHQEAALYAPTPGLADIPEMVQRSSNRVHLHVEGTPPPVPSTLGLTVFRVVQEALTNVLKHAGAEATAQVTLTYTPTLVIAEISDDGVGAAATASPDGHGLQGMHERVTSMRGQLLAQPKPTGGFLVRAIVPVPLTSPDDPSTKELP
ncbi:hypothetical protein GCM10027030_10900 [Luteococcus sediminum]